MERVDNNQIWAWACQLKRSKRSYEKASYWGDRFDVKNTLIKNKIVRVTYHQIETNKSTVVVKARFLRKSEHYYSLINQRKVTKCLMFSDQDHSSQSLWITRIAKWYFTGRPRNCRATLPHQKEIVRVVALVNKKVKP